MRANASGRTDAGVHAVGQVVNFYTATRLDCPTCWSRRSTRTCRRTCASATATEVPQSFDANKDAVREAVPLRHPRRPGRRTRSCGATPATAAAAARRRRDGPGRASACVGRHDFRSFETDWPNRLTSVRTITHLRVNRVGEYDLDRRGGGRVPVQHGAGDRRHADQRRPRLLAGGEGAGGPGRPRTAREAGPTAPPQGLFLMRVTYDG